MAGNKRKTRGGSWLRSALELLLFALWLAGSGLAGYFIGSAPSPECIPSATEAPIVESKPVAIPEGKCIETSDAEDASGLSYDQILHQWSCKNSGNAPSFDKHLLPSDGSLANTKWSSILSVDPNKFFEMYLTQYPGDTRAVQPVVVFSHKPLDRLADLPEVCKVLDIAIVPDSPGVCVAVTETYHDVASYHMLHADRKPDGSFSLTSNYLEGRNLPNNEQYAASRRMLGEYFKNAAAVKLKANQVIIAAGDSTVIGCLVESLEDAELFLNSLKFSAKAGIPLKKIFAFTSSSEVQRRLSSAGASLITLEALATVGADLSPRMRRHFLQAWLAFVIADNGVRMVWQSPGTVWLSGIGAVMDAEPGVELLWSFKGRKDKRAAPFFVSFDFFSPSGTERPVHLMHELMLHFDLILAWDSLDAVAAYRLAENNARYGTTTHIIEPSSVLHIDMLARNPIRIMEALNSAKKPNVIVIPHEGITAAEIKLLLKTTNLWLL